LCNKKGKSRRGTVAGRFVVALLLLLLLLSSRDDLAALLLRLGLPLMLLAAASFNY